MGAFISLNQIKELISSLLPAERAFYRKTQLGAKAQPLHVRLFELLEQSVSCNQEEAMRCLCMQSASQFSNIKKHLLQSLLETLVYKGRTHDPQHALQQQYLFVEKLLQLKQTALAFRQSQLAVRQTLSAHQYVLAIQLLEQQQRLLHQQQSGPYPDQLQELEQQWETAMRAQRLLGGIKLQFSRLLSISRESPIRYSTQQMEAVMNAAENLSGMAGQIADNPFLRSYWLAASIKAAFMRRDYAGAENWGQAFLSLLCQEGQLVSLTPYVFLETANTLFYNLFASRDVTAVVVSLAAFDGLARQQLRNEWLQKWQVIVLHTELKIAHKTANYPKVAAMLHPYQQLTMRSPEMFGVSEQLNFICSLAISYFVLDDFAKADALMYEIRQMNATARREDILYFSSLFHLLILFEKKDWYQLDIQLQATYHALYAKKKLRSFEKEIVLFIRKLPGFRHPDELAAAAGNLLKRLEHFSTPGHRQVYFPYFNYPGWLQSKLAGISYREFCEQQYAATMKQSPEPAA